MMSILDWQIFVINTCCLTAQYSHIVNADKHSSASSARSAKWRVRRMLLSVGVESAHWQVAKRLRS